MELLKNPGFLEAFNKAQKDVTVDKLTSVGQLKQKY